MKKPFLKRAFAFILCVAMLLSMNTFSLVATAEEGDSDGKGPDLTGLTLQNGGTIDTIKWYLYDNGLLYITGTGTIPSDGAWNSYADSITSVYVDDGITEITQGAFYALKSIESIVLPFVGCELGDGEHFGAIFGKSYYGGGFYSCNVTKSSTPYYTTASGAVTSYYKRHNLAYEYCIYSREGILLDDNHEISTDLSQYFDFDNPQLHTSSEEKTESQYMFSLIVGTVRVATNPHYSFSVKVGASGDPFVSQYAGQRCSYVGNNYYYLYTTYYYVPQTLKSVVITNENDIADMAFANCFDIESITLNDEITTIGNNAFYGCDALKEIHIPTELTSIDESAFYGDISLPSITIPSKVTTIPASCFYGCTSLVSANCEKVESVCESAFANCSQLKHIYFGNSISGLSANAFQSCTALTTVHYVGTAMDWTNVSVASGAFSSAVNIHYNTAYLPKTDDHEAGYYCDQCGEVIAEHLFHQFDGGTVSAEPTHLTDGIRTYTCTVCGITETETIDKLTEHTYGDWKTHSDTQHKKVCECGDTVYDVHHWNSGIITTQPTHTEFGVKTFTCLDCGTTRTEDVAKLTAHTYGEWTEYSSTHHQKVCACGAALYEIHHWSSEITKQATHLEVGTLSYTCTDCGAKKSEDIPKLTGHSYGVWLPYTQTQHKKVCECGDTVYANHNWNAGVIVTAPTYSSDGQKKYTCTDCGEERYETIPKLTVTANTPTISISEATALQGDTVSVTINLGNNPGFIGLNLQLTYSDKLTLISATNQVPALTFSYGKVFIWDGGEDYTGNDALLTLTFKVDETAAFGDYEIGLTVLEAFNNADDDVAFYTVNGKIEVIDFIYGDVNGDKVINTRDIVLLRKYVADKDIVTGESDVEVSFGADVNADGEINTRDIVLLRKYVAGIDPATGISDVEIGPKK